MLRTRMLAVLSGLIVLLVVATTFFLEWRHTTTQRNAADAVSEASTCGGHPLTAPRELRAMWLTSVYNVDWPSQPGLPEQTVKQEYLAWLDVAQKYHHNAIFVHIRP